jgi:hypothetical protein
VYVYVVTDIAYLQDGFAIPGPDGRWELPYIVLGGYPLPYTHRIYAVTEQDGQEIRSSEVLVIKTEEQ